MDQEKKMNKKSKRLIIALIICVFSLTLGLVSGIKVASLLNLKHQESKYDQLIDILHESWRSDIYYESENENNIINQFIGALSTSEQVRLDPYTYLKKKETTQIEKKTGKLGITLSYYYNYPVIIEVDSSGPSYDILQVGDIVLSLGKKENGVAVFYSIIDENTNYSNIFEQALSAPGDNILVKVARFDSDNKISYHDYEITLKDSIPTRYSYIENENIDDTLMVKLTSFVDSSNGTASQLDKILKNDNSNNLIIDLRDNGGGDLASVIDVCDLFLKKDILVTTLEYKNATKEFKTYDDKFYDYNKIFILQNENTASASEILISTLLYYFPEKVSLIGTKSYGKGIAQTSVSVLNNQYILQYTCAKWLRPDNSWIGMTMANKEPTDYFYPSSNCLLEKNNVLKLMETKNAYINYKENVTSYLAFQDDKVAYQNQSFFEVYNAIYNTNIRTDGYFDTTCAEAINSYQGLKGISQTSTMNQETFLYFVNDFYNTRSLYANTYLNKVSELLGA